MRKPGDLKQQAAIALQDALSQYLRWQGPEGDAGTFLDWVRDEAPEIEAAARRDSRVEISRASRYAIRRLGQLDGYAWMREVARSAAHLLRQGEPPEVLLSMLGGAKNFEAVSAVLQAASILEAEDSSVEAERELTRHGVRLAMLLGALTQRGIRVSIEQCSEAGLPAAADNLPHHWHTEVTDAARGMRASYNTESWQSAVDAVESDPWFQKLLKVGA